MNNKGVFSFAFSFLVIGVILLTLFALIIPILLNYNSSVWPKAEKQMLDANDSLNEIQNAEVKAIAIDGLSEAYNTIPTQNDVLALFFQYGWLIIIVVVAVVWFIFARQTVEAGGLA